MSKAAVLRGTVPPVPRTVAAAVVYGLVAVVVVLALAAGGHPRGAAGTGVALQGGVVALGGGVLLVRWCRAPLRERWHAHGAVALLLYGTAQTALGVQITGLTRDPSDPVTFPTSADVLGLLAVPSGVAMALTIPLPGVPPRGRRRVVPDAVLVASTGALLLWRVVFQAQLAGSAAALGTLAVVLAYLMMIAVMLQVAALRPSTGTLLLLGGLVPAAVGDTWVLQGMLDGADQWGVPGVVLMVLGWPLVVAGILLLPGRGPEVDAVTGFQLLERARLTSTVVALSVAAVTLVAFAGQPLDAVGAGLAVAVVVLWGLREVVNIVDRRTLTGLLAHQADHDPLTGLGNRRALERELTGRSRGRDPVGVALLDLDGFKAVNDRLGHTTGDELLVAVARALGAACPPGVRAFRLGGDEFAVLGPWAGDRLAATAELLVAAVRPAAAEVPGVEQVRLSASCGTAVAAAGRPDEVTDVVGRAGRAMQAAKLAGRDRVVADGAAPAVAGHRRASDQLADDLDADRLGLRLVPVVGLGDGRPVALEVVPQWIGPGGRVWEGAELADLAAASGLGPRLLAAVLRDGVRAVRRADVPGAPASGLPLVVPVTAVVLRSPGLAAAVGAVLAAEAFPAASLLLEAPHDVVTAWDDPAVGCLADLARTGVGLSIDLGEDAATTHPLLSLPLRRLRVAVPPVRDRTAAPQAALARLAVLASERDADLVVAGVDAAELVLSVRAAGATHGAGPLWPAVPVGDAPRPGTVPVARSAPAPAPSGPSSSAAGASAPDPLLPSTSRPAGGAPVRVEGRSPR